MADAIDSKSIDRKVMRVRLPPSAPHYNMTNLSLKQKDQLSYIIGIALGDGNLSNPNGRAVRLRIFCDCKYPYLIEKIKKALQDFLPKNKVSTVNRPRHCVDVSSYSNFWNTNLGWSSGQGSKFTQNASIPEWIFEKRKYIISCLRGLIETDGSIYTDRGYQMVMFVSIIPGLAHQVQTMIISFGFSSRLYELKNQKNSSGNKKPTVYHVRVSKNTSKFLQIVKPEKK
jgi:DNA-binding transcriptional regulator WhiA